MDGCVRGRGNDVWLPTRSALMGEVGERQEGARTLCEDIHTPMSLSIGIVGLPNAGKSTLFNALTRARVDVAEYPFTTISPHRGAVPVPDARLAAIASVTRPDRVVPAKVEFVDIAGLVRGAHRGEGLGNQFLAHIREVDALAHLVRCFPAPDVPHVESTLDPIRDVEIVEAELALADLAIIEHELERARGRMKAQDPRAAEDVTHLEALADRLQRGIPLHRLSPNPAWIGLVRPFRLLTLKPVLYVANVADSDLPHGSSADTLQRHASTQGAGLVVLSAKLEAEATDLSEQEAKEILHSFGLEEAGLPRLIHAAYDLLGLVTFFTTASREVRAWPVPRGTQAPQAAGRIHTDMERGFIRAEVVPWDVLTAAGSMQTARERGLVRVEGKDYEIRDGDVIFFRVAP